MRQESMRKFEEASAFSARTTGETSLVSGIVHDTEKLVKYGVQLAKYEIREEWERRKSAGIAFAVSGVAASVAFLMFCMMVPHVLYAAAGAPLWAGYALETVVLGLVAFTFVQLGKKKLEGPRGERHGTGS